VSAQIQTLLLDETPVIFPFFYDQLIAARKQLNGVRFTAIAQLYFDRATLAA
jgi:peptide/nickel transport system substrate-binding protein